jgi:tetratricopeptide (TPR) repeat protein
VTIQESLRAARQSHLAGRLAEAESLYRSVLSSQPDQPDALNMLGLIAYQAGQFKLAIQLIGRAIAVNASVGQYYSNYAAALIALHRHEAAVAACHRCLTLLPNHPQGYINLANALEATGRPEEAIAAYRRALEIRPDDPGTHNLLAASLLRANQLTEAISALTQAIVLKPDYAEAYSNLGFALTKAEKIDEAIAACARAVQLRPDYPEAHNHLGLVLAAARRLDEAVAEYRKAISLRPDFSQAQVNLGNALQRAERFDEAIATYRDAIRIDPQSSQAYYNLAGALRKSFRFDDAITAYRQAIELVPADAEAINGLGLALAEIGELPQSIAHYEQALKLRPDLADAHWNLSLSLLLSGDFERGWPEFEWRWKCKDLNIGHRIPGPAWDGSELHGKRIILHNEQGFGDVIQFTRFISEVHGRGGRVILCVDAALRRLCEQQNWPIEDCLSSSQPLPAYDVQCPLMSLPLVLGTKSNTFAQTIPYITPDAELAERWKSRLPTDGALNVGIVWGSKPNPPGRCPPPETWGLLGDLPSVRFFSLQKSFGGIKPPPLPAKLAVIDWSDELNDFADTAALAANLDLIVSVDTSVPHLAGAMGKPIWEILKFVPDWRWMMARSDSPWYPTLRLFRQPKMDDWETPMSQIASELAAIASSR